VQVRRISLLLRFHPFDVGSAGLSIANQLWDRFKTAGKGFNKGDIAIVDAADYHYYQVSVLPSFVQPILIDKSPDGSIFLFACGPHF
jgi:hypothetical protein